MAKKIIHEVRDPIHTFVYFSNDEKSIIGSPYFQRLRHIKQLSMTSLVYPGAVHTRFEHCIGAMELAGRVFDVLFLAQNRHSESWEPYRDKFDNLSLLEDWRKHLRMAALLHDVGHPPFSHATELLFPKGENHETMTKKIIMESDLTEVLQGGLEFPYKPKLIAMLAVGPKYFDDPFEAWQQLLNEIIVGDAFGVDRIDYLLRDSHHSGAVAGNFDHNRLIQTLRILKGPENSQVSIGIEHGGIHPTEALLVARYFMYMQVYLHRVSSAYNVHCERFAKAWLEDQHDGSWSTVPGEFLNFTDNELLAEIAIAARKPEAAGYKDAKRIQDRIHFKLAYEFNSDEAYLLASEPLRDGLIEALSKVCDESDYYLSLNWRKSGEDNPALKDDFPVWNRKVDPDELVHGKRYSNILDNLVNPSQDFVIADQDRLGQLKSCVENYLKDISKKEIK